MLREQFKNKEGRLRSDETPGPRRDAHGCRTRGGVAQGLHTRRETPIEAEPIEETLAVAEPGKEVPVGGVVRGDAGRGVARAENARERRPKPVKNVVERQIGGKTFRLG